MMVVTGITSLYSVCIVSVFLGLSITFALLVWYPEIKRLVSPEECQIRRGKAKLERAQEAADHDKHKFFSHPIFGEITIGKGITSAKIDPPRHTKRNWVIDRFIWLANHHVLPKRFAVRLARLLGMRVRYRK